MKPLKLVVIVLLLAVAIPTIVFADVSNGAKSSTTLDLSLSFPPYATFRLWLDNKHGLEFYPPVRFDFQGASNQFYYLKYMYKFYGDYYLGAVYLGSVVRSNNFSASGLLGTLGGEFSLYEDWLIADLGLVYIPGVPSQFALFPTAQIGARFKL